MIAGYARTAVNVQRDTVFFALSLCAAALFFSASMTVFVSLGTENFAQASAALAIGTVAGAALQSGASYGLPRTARAGTRSVHAAFSAHLALSAFFGSLTCGLALFLASDGPWRLGLLLGAVTGMQLVADGLIRARGWLLRLGALNVTLHGALLVAVWTLTLSGTLTPGRFVLLVLAVKFGFLGTAVALEGVERPALGPALWQSLRSGSAVFLAFMLGTVDIFALIILQPADAALYIAMKHFGYGLFLALVQEGAIPILIAKLITRSQIVPRVLLTAIAGISLLVGIGAAVLAVMLARLKGLENPSVIAIAGLIGTGLAMHTAAVFGLKVMYVSGWISDRAAAVMALVLIGVVSVAACAESGSTAGAAANWIAANTSVFAFFVWQLRRRGTI